MNSLSMRLPEFVYDPDNGCTFEVWYNRYEDVISKDGATLDEAAKARLIVSKLDAVTYARFTSHILPKRACEISLADTVATLKDLFGHNTSVFSRRYVYLKTQRNGENLRDYTGLVNQRHTMAEFNDVSPEQMKCLVWICGLSSSEDADIRARALRKMEDNPQTTLKELAAEIQQFLNIRQDAALPERPVSSHINAVDSQNRKRDPLSPCFRCGALHWSKDCPFLNKTCHDCGNSGHKRGFCKNFRTKKKQKPKRKRRTANNVVIASTHVDAASTSRIYRPVQINGKTIRMRLDTGADLDLAEAYLQLEVVDDSKQLLTINTHQGLYRFNRLPFRVKPAPGIFQQCIDALIAGLDGTAAYLDDILVTGRTIDEHNTRLDAVFQRIQDYGFRVRLEKCSFLQTQIKYLGFVINAQGRRPDPDKVKAIQKMPAPNDVSQLRAFLGLINFYGNFVKDLHNLRAPLDALTKKDAVYTWTPECQSSFNKIKAILNSDLLLTHYDPNLPIIVAADASNYGIGATLSHRLPNGSEKVVYHASRCLTPAQKNYSQIEKEALALIFAVQKFHRFVHGRHFTLKTDHKPLVAIFGNKKGIPVYSANRLQRWATMLLNYDFAIDVALISTGGLRHRQRRCRCICRVHRELPSTPGLYRNHPDCYKRRPCHQKGHGLHKVWKMAQD
ncbi:reverse transcriptase [Teladorsagia circumcincta]|uniref:RNA-directed DNA polymerase n=1 Tax=Teladorsagia circumcincta TaxID=45464 RepID=A0A2G9V5N8_TELCI|nr:reverse transcriptase [Teladorsagia circumcincta]